MASSARTARARRGPVVRRLGLVFALFAFNALALWWIPLDNHSKALPFEVTSFSPKGESPPGAPIEVELSRDVAGIAGGPTVGRSVPGSSILRTVPDVAGRVYWASARRLVFEPLSGFPRATPIRVILSEHLAGPGGPLLEGEREFLFWTPPLELISVRQVGYASDMRATIRFEFDDDVDPTDLETALELVDGAGSVVPFELLGRERSKAIDLRTTRAVDQLTAKVRAGLRGAGGPLGLEAAREVPVPLTYRLRLDSVHAYSADRDPMRLILRFNQSLRERDPIELAKFFEIDPPVEFEARLDGSAVELEGPFRPGVSYRIRARRGLDGAGDAVLVDDVERSVAIPDFEPRVEFAFSSRSGVIATYIARSGPRRIGIEAMNVKSVVVRAAPVLPVNLVHYLSLGEGWLRSHFVGKEVDMRVTFEAAANTVAAEEVELDSLFGREASGIWYLSLEAEESSIERDRALVVVTDLGITAKRSAHGLLVWVTSLATGRPVPGAQVRLLSFNNQTIARGATDASGLLRTDDLPAGWDSDGPSGVRVVTAELERDRSFLALRDGELPRVGFDVAGRSWIASGYDAFVYSDRGVYRPGDSLHIDGIVRDARLDAPPPIAVELEVLRPDRKRFRLLSGMLRPSGGIGFDLELPDSARTGRYVARLRIPAGADGNEESSIGETSFVVADFSPDRLRAELEIATAEASDHRGARKSERPVLPSAGSGARDARGDGHRARRFAPGDTIPIALRAELLAGLPASGMRCSLDWSLSPRRFSPAGWSEFRFGSDDPSNPRSKLLRGALGDSELDRTGAARYSFTVPALLASQPLALEFRGEVVDTSGRSVLAAASVVVDPGELYLGLREASSASDERTARASFEVAAVRPDGEAVPLEAVDVSISRVEWSRLLRRDANGRFQYVTERHEIEIEKKSIALPAGRGIFELTGIRSGIHAFRVRDPRSGQTAFAEAALGESRDRFAGVDLSRPERLELAIEHAHVRPGSRARVRFRSPFSGTLLLTVETDRVLDADVVSVGAGDTSVEVEVPRGLRSSPYIAASLVRGLAADVSGEPWFPARAFGIVPLCIDFAPRELAVTVVVPDRVRPESTLRPIVLVRDSDGTPVEAEVSLFVAGEEIRAPTSFATPNPWRAFYGKCELEVESSDIFSQVISGTERANDDATSSEEAARGVEAIGEAGGDGGDLLSPIFARRSRPLAFRIASGETDSEGRFVAERALPPFTGEVRVFAVAHAGARFGCGSHPIVVRSPVHLEPDLPRVIAPGDEVRSFVDVFNATDEDASIHLEASFTGPLRSTDTRDDSAAGIVPLANAAPPVSNPSRASGKDQETAMSERFEWDGELSARAKERIPVALRAGPESGLATARFDATSRGERSRAEIELAVRPLAPRVIRARSGVVTSASPLELEVPAGWLRGSARHRMVLAPSPRIELLGSLAWLLRYPYGGLEQTTSKVFPLLYLTDLAELLDGCGELDLGAEGHRIGELVQAGIDRIFSMRTALGGFGYYPGSDGIWSWGSIYATHFLVEAKHAGYAVDDFALEQVLQWLLARARDAAEAPLSERAYTAYVLALAGVADVDAVLDALEFLAERSEPPGKGGDTIFFLGAARLARGDASRSRELLSGDLPAAIDFRESGGSLRSSVRRDAILLSTLIDLEPASARVITLVKRLGAARRFGSWATTQENAFALLALGKWTRREEERAASYTALVEIGKRDALLLTASERRVIEDDLSGERIFIHVDGHGSLYWFLEESGVPAAGTVVEEDNGLAVRRRFFDARGELVEPGSGGIWSFRRGDVIQVELSISSARRVENVAVSDLLPAGFQVEDPHLGIASRIGSGSPSASGASLNDIERFHAPRHVELRDDRVLIFGDVEPERECRHRYAVRARSAGSFALPAVGAEAMYDPALSSRHGAGRVVVRE